MEKNNSLAVNETSLINFLKRFNKEDGLIDYRLLIKQSIDELGYTHEQYQQYYNGLPVIGCTYAIQIKGKNVESVNGEFGEIKNSDIHASLSEKDIFFIAQEEFKKQNIIEKENSDVMLNIKYKELVWCKDIMDKESEYQLSYKVHLYSSDNSIESYYYYLDASNGNLLMIENINCHLNTPTNVPTMYSGTKGIVTDSYNSSYRLQELRQNVNIGTFDAQHFLVTPPSFINLTDNDNNWTLAEHGLDQYALDAHWAAEKVFDYWKSVHNRNSLDNAGLTIKSNVHFGTNYNNAVWLGPPNNLVVYGDGNGIKYSSFTSLDVCAHEFGHGITQFLNGLIASTGESAALNEGFSDIWGAVIENWAAPNSPPKNKWLGGEEIYLIPPFYSRNMSNPNLSADPQPDTYLGTNWNFGGDAHINSGVLNYWFYLLTEGGCGTNDIQNNYFVKGIGIDKAAKIAYETEKLLASNATYNSCRTQSLLAAQTVYGNNSLEYLSVANAWYAVGVGASIPYPYGGPTFSIYGPSVLCSSNPQGTFSINNLPAGTTNLIWTTSYNLYVPNNGNNNTNPITIARVPSEPHVGGGVIWSSFTAPYTYTNVNNTCTQTVTANFNLQKNITLTTTGGSANTVASIKRRCMSNANISQTCLEQGDINDFYISTTSNPSNLIVTDVTWSVNNGASIIVPSGYSNVSIYIPSAGTYTVTAVITYNNCSVKTLTKTLTTGNCPCDVHWDDAARHSSNPMVPSVVDVDIEKKGLLEETKSINIYPNPVNDDKLYVKLKDFAEDFYYKIISIDGRILDTKNKIQNDFINVKELPNGIYFLDILNNGEKSLHKFIVNK